MDRVDTHISIVFLIANRAYKLKARRLLLLSGLFHDCLARKIPQGGTRPQSTNCPTIHLRVRAIGRGAHGNLLFNDGAIIDWVMETHRFSQSDLFDYLANGHKLTPQLMHDLTDVIAAFHSTAAITPGNGGRAGIEETVAGNPINLL